MDNKEIITSIGTEITKSKMGGYGCNNDDFAGEREIMVTITLAEYRNLVKGAAEAEKKEAQSKVWELKAECSELKKELEHLKKYVLVYEPVEENHET